ncbi:mannitol dehydrogenase family protein (plasmid) [Embleya sp. NBC_00888]|uniref:mannitol dehydrogenase family protein n=1 Tax=Embleya sp. NBC_00888 TaxID=2975960 RepID=UPI002F9119A5|nr:mannitol dehydrogenase family protein [Embleya sp. NBC_00888]
MKLNSANLSSIARSVPTPTYDRSALRAGIVHIGVGGFHRAHQAMYLDALFNDGRDLDFGVVGVGLLPQDSRMRDVMQAQDCLYTLVEKSPSGSRRPRVIGSMVRYLFAPDAPEAVLSALVDPAIRIVSLTITEGGYPVKQSSGEFDGTDASIRTDLRPGAPPRSAFGYLTEALARRREAGTDPFVVMSCDNIPHNGRLAREALTAFARLRDEELADWIEKEVSFPGSMVDRITPVTSDLDRVRLARDSGIEDTWPVGCEPFTQWVLEDRFPIGRPALERVGVQMVDDVEPYELMKLRLLNAGHQALCYLGHLSGARHIHEICQDPLFVRFLRGYMDHEATPTLPPVPGVDLAHYKAQLIERFANPAIGDTLDRLCAQTSDRIPKFLLPVTHRRLDDRGDVHRSALVVASWARYAEGTGENGEPIDVVDRRRDELMARATRYREDPLAFLDDRELFGDLRDNPRFTRPYLEALESLHRVGARATLERWESRR